jgi:hypothetical protein
MRITPASLAAVSIVALAGPYLGLESGDTIWINQTAAGYDWFTDPSPAADQEFAANSPGVRGKVDLLTVVAHELGHALGMNHDDGDSVMTEELAPGVRRHPNAGDQDSVAQEPLQFPGSRTDRQPLAESEAATFLPDGKLAAGSALGVPSIGSAPSSPPLKAESDKGEPNASGRATSRSTVDRLFSARWKASESQRPLGGLAKEELDMLALGLLSRS